MSATNQFELNLLDLFIANVDINKPFLLCSTYQAQRVESVLEIEGEL